MTELRKRHVKLLTTFNIFMRTDNRKSSSEWTSNKGTQTLKQFFHILLSKINYKLFYNHSEYSPVKIQSNNNKFKK